MRFKKGRAESHKSAQPAQPAQPIEVPQPASPSADIPDELIAARAYEIWQRRGCPMGQDGAQDWNAARQELEQERLGWAAPRQDDKRLDPG